MSEVSAWDARLTVGQEMWLACDMPSSLRPELISAIDQLCKPRRHSEIQPILEFRPLPGELNQPVMFEEVQIGRQRRTITEPSILYQLADAVMSSMGGTSGGATLPHERLIFNAAALTLWGEITSIVGSWRGLDFGEGTPPLSDPGLVEHALREWAINILRYSVPEEKLDQKARADVISGWSRSIHAALHPARELVQAGIPCPECGALDFWSEGSLFKHPLVIRYYTDSRDVVATATGHCRACGTGWPARALAWDLEHPKKAQTSDDETTLAPEATLAVE